MNKALFKRSSLNGLLGLLFALALFCTLAWKSGEATLSTLRAQSWVETPCDIDRVQTERHSKGRRGRSSDYSIDMRYTYEFEGRRYVGHTHDFWDTRYGKASASERRQLILENPAPTCYVNPGNPRESVFDRSMDTTTALVQLLLIVGIGVIGIYSPRYCKRRENDRKHLPHHQNERPRYRNQRPRA